MPEIPSLWPDFSEFLPPEEELTKMRERHEQKQRQKQAAQAQAAALLSTLRGQPGVLYAREVCSFDPDVPAVAVVLDTAERQANFIAGLPVSEPDEETKGYYTGRGEPIPTCHLMGGVPVFSSVLPAPHSDLPETTDHFEIEGRLHYADDSTPPHWQHVSSAIPRSPNSTYEKEHPAEKRAVTLAENWLKRALVRDEEDEEIDEEAGIEPRPLPVRAEYRIIHVVTTRRMVGENSEVRNEGDQQGGGGENPQDG